MKVRVVGVGQLAAGDDGVGRRVIGELRSRALPEETFLLEVSEPSGLVEWLGEAVPTVVIDAVVADAEVGGAAGCVVELTPEQLATKAPLRVSSHGLGVSEAIELVVRSIYWRVKTSVGSHFRVVQIKIRI